MSLSAGWSCGLAPLGEGKRPLSIFSAVSLCRSLQVPGSIAVGGAQWCRGAVLMAEAGHSLTAALQPSMDFPGRGFLTGGKSRAALPLLWLPQPRSNLVWGKAVGECVDSKNSTDASHS